MSEPRTGPEQHERLERRVVAALEDLRPDRDPSVRMQLDRARHRALVDPGPRLRRWWVAGPALATACLIAALVVTQQPPGTGSNAAELPMTADLDIITDPHFDLLLEDPEFVAWLATDGASASEQEQSG